MKGEFKTAVDGGGVNSGAEHEESDAGRAGGEIVGDGRGDRVAEAVTKTESHEVVDGEKRRTDRGANTGCFECSIVRAARDVPKGRDQLGRAVKVRVLHELVGKEIKTTRLKVGGSMNSRGRWHKQFDGMRRSAKDKTQERCRGWCR